MLTNVFSNLGSGAFAVAIFGALVFGVFAVGMIFAQVLFAAIPALEPWIFRRFNLTPYKGAQPVTGLAYSTYQIGARLEQIASPVRLGARAAAMAARREADSFLKTIHHAQRVERINKARAIRGRRIRSDGSRILDNGAVVFREARPCVSCGRQRKIFVLPELSLELNARTATTSESARCLLCSTGSPENFSRNVRNSNQKEQAI